MLKGKKFDAFTLSKTLNVHSKLLNGRSVSMNGDFS